MIENIKKYFFRIKRRISILLGWLPIIWNDYDFDYEYILIALRHKIARTKIDMEKCGRHKFIKKDIKEMDLAIKYLNRIIDSPPKLRTRYFCECVSEDNSFQLKFMCISCKNHYRNNKDYGLEYSLLFKLLEKKITKWWN